MLNLVLTHFGVAHWYHVFPSAIWGDMPISLKSVLLQKALLPLMTNSVIQISVATYYKNLMVSTEKAQPKRQLVFYLADKTGDLNPGHSFSSLGEVRRSQDM